MLIIALAISLQTFGQDPNFHIYLLFGQSNMEGAGAAAGADRYTNPRVKVLQDMDCPTINRTYGNWYLATAPINRCVGGLGIADYFGKTMADSMPSNVTIGLVPAAYQGTPIEWWQKSAPLGRNNKDFPAQFNGGYAWLLDLAKKAQKVGVIKGIIFHQGEANSGNWEWKYKVQEIVNDLRKDLNIPNVPFIAGELLYPQYNSCCGTHNLEVNKLPDFVTNAYVVSASGLAGRDNAHFTDEAYRQYGRRYASKMLSVLKKNCIPSGITPYIQINGTGVSNVTTLSVVKESTVTFKPQTNSAGTWKWTGCGINGSGHEKSYTSSSYCLTNITFTNSCGTNTAVTYKINPNASKNPSPSPVLGTEDTEIQNFEIYPIPCQNTLNIVTPYSYSVTKTTITIVNSEQKVISRESIESSETISINTAHLQQGMYFIKISTENNEVVKKFIKLD